MAHRCPQGAGPFTPGTRKNQLNTDVHIFWEDSQMQVPRGRRNHVKKNKEQRKPASLH